jgi:hypothetical protein
MNRQPSRNPHWVKWLIFTLTLLTLASCATNPPQSPALEPIIPETTKIPDQATRDALTVFDTTTGVMRFNASTPLLDALQPNDVLVSEPATAAPFGFLRKVTAVRKEGGEVVVETTQAKLTEAVHQGSLNVEGKIAADQLRQVTPLSEGASGRAITENSGELAPQFQTGTGNGFNFEAKIDQVFEVETENDGVAGKATVTFSGLVRFNVGYKVALEIGLIADLNWFEASMGFDEETTISITADAEGTMKKEYEVDRFDFDPIVFFIGPVPVVLIPSAKVIVGVDGKATVHFDYTFSQSGGYLQGVRWDEDDGWSPINKNGFDVKHEGPNFEGTMDLRAYGRSNMRVLLYGLAGPDIGLAVGARLDVAYPREPLWVLSGFIRGDIAMTIDLIGEEERYDTELFNIERQIASGSAAPPAITILNTNPTIDLGFPTDLAQFFKIEDQIGLQYSALSSDKDGNLSSLYTFSSDGPRTVTVTARSNSGKTAQAFFTVNVINTPPDPPALADETNLSVGQGDEFDLNLQAGLPFDKNSVLDCAAVRWSVLGSDSLVTEAGSSSGCNATAIFSEQGSRTVKVTITDPQGLSNEQTFNISVGAPPAVKSPKIAFITVNGGSFKPGDLVRDDITTPSFPSLMASVEVENPDNVPVRLAWSVINTSGIYFGNSGISSEASSITVNVGETAAFFYYDPETFTGITLNEPICLNDRNASIDTATIKLVVHIEGRTTPRVKTFNFRCESYVPGPK